MLLLEPPKMLLVYNRTHTGWQQGGIPEEGENRRTSSRVYLSHAFQAPSMSAYPPDAVSAAEPLCTQGKDHPGLGPPNSLKLLSLLLLLLLLLSLLLLVDIN